MTPISPSRRFLASFKRRLAAGKAVRQDWPLWCQWCGAPVWTAVSAPGLSDLVVCVPCFERLDHVSKATARA